MTPLRKTTSLLASLALFAAGALGLPADATGQARQQQQAPQERARPDQANREIETVRQRLKVMRLAVEAFVKVENRKAAALVERAMHARELAIEGVRTEEARRIREAAPTRGQLAEHLAAASQLYVRWKMPDRAEALVKLAEVYGQQWRRELRAEQQGRTSEREGQQQGRGLDSRARRVQFLEIARKAYDEAGWERNARTLAATVRYGNLELQGAGPEELRAAAEGVPSIGNLIELLQGAHKLLVEKGQMERAMACNQLAEFYAARERAQRAEGEPQRDRPRPGNLEDRAHRLEILRLAHAAHAERSDDRGSAELMERILHFAELQLEGASAEAISKAAKGLSQSMIIELVQEAAGLYAERGAPDRADMCQRLAQFYRDREAGVAGGGEREPERGRDIDRQAIIRELQNRVERLQQELREVQEILRRLSDR